MKHTKWYSLAIGMLVGATLAYGSSGSAPAPVDECPRVFSIPVTGVDVPVVAVRIHLDQREGGNWNEIDAVELVGIEAEW